MKNDDENEFDTCPFCKDTEDKKGVPKGMLMVLHDWSNMHGRETLIHCWDCDRKYIFYYKFVKVVELLEKEIELWFDNDSE